MIEAASTSSLSVGHSNDLMDHGDLSAIAAFNKAHDESQRARRAATQSPEKPAPIVYQKPSVIQQTSKVEPSRVSSAPATPIAAPAPAPRASAPVTPPVPPLAIVQTSTYVPSTTGVKRAAEGPLDTLGSSPKRQQLLPPSTPSQSRIKEASSGSQTTAQETPRPLIEESASRSEYISDSDDDYERESADDSLPGALGYSFSSAFSNGQLLDPSQHLRIQSLPILDNLSSQLLSTLLQGQFQDTLITVTQPETDQGQAYATLKALFFQTKRLYSSEAFLSTDELRFQVAEHRNMIRQVNLATFVTSLFGSTEVGFFHLNRYFLSTFVPEGGRLLKNQGGLFLGLKTQAYISAIDTGEKTKEQLLDDLFEDDIAGKLTDRRGGSKELIPSEIEFLGRVKNRREQLERAPLDVPVLREIYPWQDWLREMIQYVTKHRDSILAPTTRRKLKRLEAAQGDSNKHMFQAQTQTPGSLYGQHSTLYTPPPGSQPVYPGYSSVGRPSMHAAYSAHVAAPGISQTSLSGNSPNPALSVGTSQAVTPHPEQSTPTHILYEQARLAATARQSPNARRAGLPSQRRPWSTEEEHALMVGLDYVKGPHWSQILAMFGAGGTVSEALKDRNQVQLKDKARNLKLFFLKSGMDVPYYLQFVTGELKTRAPGQVAKNEKRKQQEEEAIQNRATVDALNVLAGGATNGEGHSALRAHGHHSQPMLQPPRPQPTPVPTAHHPQRWAMSQGSPPSQSHSTVTPKTEPANHYHNTQATPRQQVQSQAAQYHTTPSTAANQHQQATRAPQISQSQIQAQAQSQPQRAAASASPQQPVATQIQTASHVQRPPSTPVAAAPPSSTAAVHKQTPPVTPLKTPSVSAVPQQQSPRQALATQKPTAVTALQPSASQATTTTQVASSAVAVASHSSPSAVSTPSKLPSSNIPNSNGHTPLLLPSFPAPSAPQPQASSTISQSPSVAPTPPQPLASPAIQGLAEAMATNVE
ncbi:TTAGGG repeat binding factor [Orbilia oligospora]|nr:TTAGGG repeat binding factor [Orbilia oligospora]KAF3116352.1 TTAGGG repeat binding factor [Orbilia oligospora]KAF3133556.1 TTAGGG repeat binding factor [Orbilia oligospora]KAF3154297.1 TTAGGG repeat binding factor [Orbilia oligospora]